MAVIQSELLTIAIVKPVRGNRKRSHKVASDEIVIDIRNVSKRYGSFTAVKDVSLQVGKSEVICIIGPSGSGKSTLLRCMNFLEEYDKGEIYISDQLLGYKKLDDGSLKRSSKKQVDQVRQQVGMVFQHFNLWPHRTALGNVTEALVRVKKKSRTSANKIGMEMLSLVGLKDKADVYPGSLSGGQKQRVAIARALALNPEVVLFDEPTSALDPELVGEVLQVMQKLAEEQVTMVIVTHEMGFAAGVADKIVFMDEGCLVEKGSVEQVLKNPENPRLKQFLSTWINRNTLWS